MTNLLPNELYTIKIYNHAGELYTILKQWGRLEYSQRINGSWNHSVQIRVSPEQTLGNTLRSLPRDYFFIVERIDPYTGILDTVYEGLHQTSSEQLQTDGNIIFTLYGAGYSKLLDRRLVIPPDGLENSEKTGYAEEVIKSFVYDSMIYPTPPPRLSTLTYDPHRIMHGLSIAANLQRGRTVTYSARYTNLESVVQSITDDGLLDFGIYGGDELGKFIFDARPIWGSDRRENNAAGNVPAVFSTDLSNMVLPILSTNHRHEKNYVFMAGAGQGTDRLIEEVWDAEAISGSPWGRSELFQDARRGETADELISRGRGVLVDRGAQTNLDFEIRQTPGSRWIRDWGLGDYVTAKYQNVTLDKQIEEITVVVSGGSSTQQAESIAVSLKDVRYG